MREPNLCFPSQNRAVICITSGLYDRRALDCTATLPLVNSLTHLVYLTSTTPRIREILCLDGGLERLVRILYQNTDKTDRLNLWKLTLAFQNIVNIGVRGTEQIRTKVVEAGIIPFIIDILENFAKSFRSDKNSAENSLDTTSLPATTAPKIAKDVLRRSTFPYVKIDPMKRRHNRIHKRMDRSKDMNVFHREEDVLLCLQLLAYLSKYPHIRDLFHKEYQKNVFSTVEKFCHRNHSAPIQYWAGVIMRNACRKDETRNGIRRCAYMSCGKWESQPREFAKCRRCRKAKYCSKPCQSKAWADGHRWWCIERASTHHIPNASHTIMATNTAATNTNTTNSMSIDTTRRLHRRLNEQSTSTSTTTNSGDNTNENSANNASFSFNMSFNIERNNSSEGSNNENTNNNNNFAFNMTINF